MIRLAFFASALFLMSACNGNRASLCPDLQVVSISDEDFMRFAKQQPYINPAYQNDGKKKSDLVKLGKPSALDRPDTATLLLNREFRSPFKKWVSVKVTVKTRDNLTVQYSEVMDPKEYDFFCSSGKFVISERRVGKTISVE